MQPVLETRRLSLRPTLAEDLEALWDLWRNPDVRRFLWDDVEIDREKARETIQTFAELAPKGLGLWTIARRDNADVIGCAGLSPVGNAAQFYPALSGAIEPLIALAPAAWHQGYASEALTALVEHATETLQIDRLAAIVDVPNTRSDRLVRRTGFVVCAETDGPRYTLRHYLYQSHRVATAALAAQC